MEIYDTYNLKNGVLELHEPRYIVIKRKDGTIEYKEIDFHAYPAPWVNIDPLQDERKIQRIGRKVNKIEHTEQSRNYDEWAEFTVIQRNPHIIDIILQDFDSEQDEQDIEAGDVILRITSY